MKTTTTKAKQRPEVAVTQPKVKVAVANPKPESKPPAVWYAPIPAISMVAVIKELKPTIVRDLHRKQIYKILIKALEAGGWASHAECKGIDTSFDTALEELHPKQ